MKHQETCNNAHSEDLGLSLLTNDFYGRERGCQASWLKFMHPENFHFHNKDVLEMLRCVVFF